MAEGKGFLSRLWPQRGENVQERKAGTPRQDIEPPRVVAGDTVVAVPRNEPTTFTRVRTGPITIERTEGRRGMGQLPPAEPRVGSAAWMRGKETTILSNPPRTRRPAKRSGSRAKARTRQATKPRAKPSTVKRKASKAKARAKAKVGRAKAKVQRAVPGGGRKKR